MNNLHIGWARLFARGLCASGVSDVVVSPGSRSTPLVLGVDAEPGLRKHVVIDERSAAFFALGQARLTGRPTALLCTSGTAGAHYLPAVAEASLSHVPLVVVTADRPWEAYDCAASQTIDQTKLFGDHVRHFAELGLPDEAALPAVLRVAAQAVLRSRWPTPGPVHVNARFRKPLEPVDVRGPEPHEAEVERLLRAGPPLLFPPCAAPDPAAIEALARAVVGCERGLIVAGPAPAWGDGPALAALGRLLGYPVCAEATSQLRGDRVVSCFDALLRCRAFAERHAPEVVVEIGLPPVSGAYASWIAARPRVRRFVLAPHGWSDPLGSAHAMIWADPAAAARALALAVEDRIEPYGRRSPWEQAWGEAQRAAEALVEGELAQGALTEGAVARAVARKTPAGAALLVGNSGPVRDLDLYGENLQPGVRVLHQRGAAGIDGLVAGAAGASAAAGGAPVVLYLGDVALLHDVGSLQLAAQAAGPLVIVATNNDGGRIFEQLPLARRAEAAGAFERYFVTPHGRRFGELARAFGLAYAQAAAPAALDEALSEALGRPGATLIEALVPPDDGAQRRAQLWRRLDERLGGAR